MNLEVIKVSLEEKTILSNLSKMYCYEWSQYDKLDVNEQGDYEHEYDLADSWNKENHYQYFIKVNEILAGFVLIDDDLAMHLNYDYSIAEFFIMHKYRRAGVGRYAAKFVFDMFLEKWEIVHHPHNIMSVEFWASVVDEYTNGKYEIIRSYPNLKYHDGTYADVISFEN